jgi:steroid delta-isomerase-like uncharacterized protein
MSTPRELAIQELEQVWSNADLGAIDRLYAADLVDHDAVPGLPPGAAGLKLFVAMFHEAFGDARFDLQVALEQGDLVARRWAMTATHRGPFLGIPPTGRTVRMTGIDLMRIRDGRIAEVWHNEDIAGLMQQLTAP